MLPPHPLDAQFAGLDTLRPDQSYYHYRDLFKIIEDDPAARARVRRVALGEVRLGRFQRFVASTIVAGFGHPTGCNRMGAENTQLGDYLAYFRETPFFADYHYPVSFSHAKITCEPRLSTLRLGVPWPVWESSYSLQRFLWDILEKYHLEFRILPDSTFYIVSGTPDVSAAVVRGRGDRGARSATFGAAQYP
jgi:hypothetical protein